MAFDIFNPPNRSLLDTCVHCGFCLTTCPTYVLDGEEMDSPRGRIHLMDQVLSGAPLDGKAALHFDRCLSCMACVTSCPSGVRYDKLIEATRAQLERNVRRPFKERVARGIIFHLFPYPVRLRVVRIFLSIARRTRLLALLRSGFVGRLLPSTLRGATLLVPDLLSPCELSRHSAARETPRGTVALLTGCVQSVFFSHINESTVRVLTAEGFDVLVPRSQGCCGALSAHAGREKEAIAFAKKTIDGLMESSPDFIVVNAAGCGSVLKEYAYMLRDEPTYRTRAEDFVARTRDLSELLASFEPRATRRRLAMTVAYQDACHLAHAQGIRSEPRLLLDSIPGVVLLELEEAELCCGSAGIYNLVQVDAARRLGDRKAAHIDETNADLVVTTNTGCLLQLRASLRRTGSTTRVAHIAEVLDVAISSENAATTRAAERIGVKEL